MSQIDIDQSDFARLVDNYHGRVNILTGTHGDDFGNLTRKKDFFVEDLRKWNGKPNVDIIDVFTLTSGQFKKAVNAPGRVICAWCFSERSKKVIDALKNP